jgi:hypothetical protein
MRAWFKMVQMEVAAIEIIHGYLTSLPLSM